MGEAATVIIPDTYIALNCVHRLCSKHFINEPPAAPRVPYTDIAIFTP